MARAISSGVCAICLECHEPGCPSNDPKGSLQSLVHVAGSASLSCTKSPAPASLGRSVRLEAEGQGFEPWVRGSPAQRFSRPSHSTALPPLRARRNDRTPCVGARSAGGPSTLSQPRRGGRVAEGTRLLSEYGAKSPSRVRIPPSPLLQKPVLAGIFVDHA